MAHPGPSIALETALAPVSAASSAGLAGVAEPSAADLDAAFARFLRLDVADGDAAPETVRSYRTQVSAWVAWCRDAAVDPARATVDDVKRYRQDLVAAEYTPGTIANKLTVLRRFYAAAQAAGFRQDNPAVGVRAPREKKAAEDFGYLSEVELTLLFRAAPALNKEGPLRDRAVLALFGLEGLRTVEIQRANRDDLQQRADGWALLVRQVPRPAGLLARGRGRGGDKLSRGAGARLARSAWDAAVCRREQPGPRSAHHGPRRAFCG
jgi:integrase